MENEIKNIVAEHLENLDDFRSYMEALSVSMSGGIKGISPSINTSLENMLNSDSDFLPKMNIKRIKQELKETMDFAAGIQSGTNLK